LIVLSTSFFSRKLILTDECVLFSRFFAFVNQIDSRASVISLYASIFSWNLFIELSNDAISTYCTILSNQISSSWIDLIENSFSQTDRHWINWFAVFFFETMNITLFSVLDKLIIVTKISIFWSFNLLLSRDVIIRNTKDCESRVLMIKRSQR
jgi:hypothetical protein